MAGNTESGLDPNKDLFGDKSGQSEESKLVDVINGVMDTKGISVRTVLTDRHIVAITQGLIFAATYKSDITALLCQTLMEVRISLDGRGRKDLISALKSVIPSMDVSNEPTSKRFGGLF